MKSNTLDYINKILSGGYKNTLSYVNNITVVNGDADKTPEQEPDYLCFTSTGESTVGIINDGGNAPVLFYSTDKENWTSWDYSTITLNDGESVYFYGENPDGFSKGVNKYSQFGISGFMAASGNIQTLLSKQGDRLDVPEFCYYLMFESCSYLTTAPELPATTLSPYCYDSMFYACTNLETAPVLPATTLANGCYGTMFTNCTNLQSVTAYATEWDTANSVTWLGEAGTAATNPTVYCPSDSTIPSDDVSGIPTGWTRADIQM